MEFQENMSGGSHAIPCRRTNKWAGMKLIVVFRNCFANACIKGMDVWGVGFRVMIYTVLFCVIIPISLLIGSSVSEGHTDFIIRAEVSSIQKMRDSLLS